MSAQFIFTMRRVSRFHPPDREVLKDITLAFYPGAKIGVIGANGAGKSSLLRIMAGVDDGFTGEARLTDGFTVGLLEQEPTLDESKDVQGNIMDGVGQVAGLLARYDEVLAAWGDPDADYEKLGDEQADLEKRIEAAGAWDLQRTIEIAIDALRLPPGDADVSTLSGGERRRVALCRLLLSRPDLLLLDEPTNHLDAESVAWLERTLKDYHGTVVAITHDRYFLDNVAGWILELDHGKGIPYEGNYSGWLEQKQARLDAEQRADSSRRRTLERELEWVRMAPKARQAKGKARLAAYDRLVAEAADVERRDRELQVDIRSAPPSRWAPSTSHATPSIPSAPSTRRSPTAASPSRSAAGRSTAGPTWRRSTSRAPTSRSRSGTCRAASATGCTWPRCSRAAPTCCSSTSPPTTSTSTRCERWSRASRPTPAAP